MLRRLSLCTFLQVNLAVPHIKSLYFLRLVSPQASDVRWGIWAACARASHAAPWNCTRSSAGYSASPSWNHLEHTLFSSPRVASSLVLQPITTGFVGWETLASLVALYHQKHRSLLRNNLHNMWALYLLALTVFLLSVATLCIELSFFVSGRQRAQSSHFDAQAVASVFPTSAGVDFSSGTHVSLGSALWLQAVSTGCIALGMAAAMLALVFSVLHHDRLVLHTGATYPTKWDSVGLVRLGTGYALPQHRHNKHHPNNIPPRQNHRNSSSAALLPNQSLASPSSDLPRAGNPQRHHLSAHYMDRTLSPYHTYDLPHDSSRQAAMNPAWTYSKHAITNRLLGHENAHDKDNQHHTAFSACPDTNETVIRMASRDQEHRFPWETVWNEVNSRRIQHAASTKPINSSLDVQGSPSSEVMSLPLSHWDEKKERTDTSPIRVRDSLRGTGGSRIQSDLVPYRRLDVNLTNPARSHSAFYPNPRVDVSKYSPELHRQHRQSDIIPRPHWGSRQVGYPILSQGEPPLPSRWNPPRYPAAASLARRRIQSDILPSPRPRTQLMPEPRSQSALYPTPRTRVSTALSHLIWADGASEPGSRSEPYRVAAAPVPLNPVTIRGSHPRRRTSFCGETAPTELQALSRRGLPRRPDRLHTRHEAHRPLLPRLPYMEPELVSTSMVDIGVNRDIPRSRASVPLSAPAPDLEGALPHSRRFPAHAISGEYPILEHASPWHLDPPPQGYAQSRKGKEGEAEGKSGWGSVMSRNADTRQEMNLGWRKYGSAPLPPAYDNFTTLQPHSWYSAADTKPSIRIQHKSRGSINGYEVPLQNEEPPGNSSIDSWEMDAWELARARGRVALEPCDKKHLFGHVFVPENIASSSRFSEAGSALSALNPECPTSSHSTKSSNELHKVQHDFSHQTREAQDMHAPLQQQQPTDSTEYSSEQKHTAGPHRPNHALAMFRNDSDHPRSSVFKNNSSGAVSSAGQCKSFRRVQFGSSEASAPRGTTRAAPARTIGRAFVPSLHRRTTSSHGSRSFRAAAS